MYTTFMWHDFSQRSSDIIKSVFEDIVQGDPEKVNHKVIHYVLYCNICKIV